MKIKTIFGRLITLFLLIICLTSCTDTDKATRILQDQGYKDITITGYKTWSCSSDDTFKTGFTAKSTIGKTIEGTVCSSWAKGSTIRID